MNTAAAPVTPMAPLAPVTIAAMLRDRADDDGIGLRFEDASWTWREIVAACEQRAMWMQVNTRTDRPPHVGVLLENEPEFLFLFGAAALAGIAIVGINPTRRGNELAADIRHTDCQLLFTNAAFRAELAGLDLGATRVVAIDDAEYLEAVAAVPVGNATEWPIVTPETLMVLLFTSGSTGAPKAVRMSQGRAASTAARSRFGPDDVLYCAMPMFHGNALHTCVFPAMNSGAALALRRRFSASEFLPDVRRNGATFFNTVGRALAYVLATPASPDDRNHRVKYALGPESSQTDIDAFRARFGILVVEGYGSSENAIVMAPAPHMPKGALGQPLDGQDVVVMNATTRVECPRAAIDDDGRLLNAEEAIGELVSRDAVARFEGYYNNPEAEAERTRNGWYWSGDLAYRDADGWFWFAGRTADWLRVDGENFAAAPVERIVARAPGVAGVAIYGVPDPVTGDNVMAAIELDNGVAFDPTAFAAFLAEQRDLGTKWAPRYVRVVEQLPLTTTNKVAKIPLRAEAWECADSVWWQPARNEPYRILTAQDCSDLRESFDTNRRSALLPAEAERTP